MTVCKTGKTCLPKQTPLQSMTFGFCDVDNESSGSNVVVACDSILHSVKVLWLSV